MPPDAWGSCRQCLTFDWECVCSDRWNEETAPEHVELGLEVSEPSPPLHIPQSLRKRTRRLQEETAEESSSDETDDFF